MTDRPLFRSILQTVSAFVFLVPPVMLWIHWVRIVSENPDLTRAERSIMYAGQFPSFIQNPALIAGVGFVCCLLSLISSILGVRDPRTWLRLTDAILILGGSVMLFLTFVPLI